MSEDHTADLAFATFDELASELKKRCETALIYADVQDRNEWKFYYARKGDVLRLYGAIELRVLPELQSAHKQSMSQGDITAQDEE